MRRLHATTGGRPAALLNLLLVLALITSAVAPMAATAAPVVIASGTVTSASSTDPIPGAYVSVRFNDPGMGWSDLGGVTTDANGDYTIYDDAGNGAGEYQLTVSATSFVTQKDTPVSWDGATTVPMDFALTDATQISSGMVTDAATTAAIGGAQILAERDASGSGEWVQAGYAVTGIDGGYTVYDEAGLGAGNYRLTAIAAGYVADDITSAWDGSTPLALNLALDRPTPLATGTVSSSGLGLEGAYVWAEFHDPTSGEWWNAGSTITDANGDFSLLDIGQYGAGEYRFSAAAGGYQLGTQTGTWNGTDSLVVDFELLPETPLATGSITETVTGDPIVGATVQAEFYDADDKQWLYAGETLTVAGGAYELPDDYLYGAGDYRIWAWADGYEALTALVTRTGIETLHVDLVLSPPTLDAFEPDDTSGTAKPLVLGADPQARTLFPAGDLDWASFEATAGTTYAFETTQRGPVATDTYLTLFAGDGTTVLAQNDDSGSALARIEWLAEEDRTVYVRVRHADDGVGTGLYGLRAILDPTVPNQAPVAVADSYSVDEDEVLAVAAPGVLSNDTDPDSDPEFDPLTSVRDTDVADGELTLNSDGGFSYVPEADFFGTDTFTYHANDGELNSNTVTVTITVNPIDEPPTELVITPIAGASRIDTAIEASKKAFPEGADTVVIATGYNWPDALGGASLAGALGGPILLTKPDTLPATVLAEVDRLGAGKAVILGGTGAVSPAVESSLNAVLGSANVDRIAGDNRYETARMISARCVDELGASYDGTAFLATGLNFPDALGASPLAAAKGWPIYLVKPTTGADAALVSALRSDGVEHVLVLGGTGAIPDSIVGTIRTSVPSTTERLAGANRYATACDVASYGVDHAGLEWNRLAIATGQNFPDALAGGVLQGTSGSVMLLTPTTTLSTDVAQILEQNKATIAEVRFLGGTAAVSQAVRDAVQNILE